MFLFLGKWIGFKGKYIEYFCNIRIETNSLYKNMLHFSISRSLQRFIYTYRYSIRTPNTVSQFKNFYSFSKLFFLSIFIRIHLLPFRYPFYVFFIHIHISLLHFFSFPTQLFFFFVLQNNICQNEFVCQLITCFSNFSNFSNL